MNDKSYNFWFQFGAKHRVDTARICHSLSKTKITREQFATLVSEKRDRMPPSKAKKIYDFLRMNGELSYPDWSDDDTD